MTPTICCLEPVLASYSVPRFQAFQSMRRDCAVHVMALGTTQAIREGHLRKSELGFGYEEAVPVESVERIDPKLSVARVNRWLESLDPAAVVITGYYYPAMRAAARWARERRRPSIFMGDSQWGDRPRNVVREWAKGWWARRHFDAAFAAGERTAAYLQQMGFPRERVWTGYDVVDNAAFAAGASAARADAPARRKRLGLPNQFFLFAGRFAPEKNLPRLLAAYASYRRAVVRNAWGLVLVGRGPLEESLRRQAETIDGVIFAGFQQAEHLAGYYGLASCLVLPSISETWGLVVNEAMAAGLPVLVSHRCGCVPELVRSGWNGYVCDPLDLDGMAQSMRVLSSPAVDLASMGAASRQIVASYTPETWAQGLADCIDQTIARIEQPVVDRGSSWPRFFKAEKQLN